MTTTIQLFKYKQQLVKIPTKLPHKTFFSSCLHCTLFNKTFSIAASFIHRILFPGCKGKIFQMSMVCYQDAVMVLCITNLKKWRLTLSGWKGPWGLTVDCIKSTHIHTVYNWLTYSYCISSTVNHTSYSSQIITWKRWPDNSLQSIFWFFFILEWRANSGRTWPRHLSFLPCVWRQTFHNVRTSIKAIQCLYF